MNGKFLYGYGNEMTFVILLSAIILVFCLATNTRASSIESDLNNDLFVDWFDYAILAYYWLDTNCADYNNCGGADFEPNDGTVDINDLNYFCSDWLASEFVEVEANFTSIAAHDGRVWDSGIGYFGQAYDSDDDALRTGSYQEGQTHVVYRTVVSFDTSTLPSDCNLTSAWLELTRGEFWGSEDPFDWGGNCVIDVNKPCIGSSTTLAGEDYLALSNATAVASFSADPGENQVMTSTYFDSNGLNNININGTTQMKVYFDDVDHSDPNLGFLGFFSCDSTYTEKHPKFRVRYLTEGRPVVTFSSLAADDGRIHYDGSSYGTNSGDSGNMALMLGDEYVGPTSQGYRNILSFDTSSLPDDYEIISTKLSLTRGASSGNDPFNWAGNCLIDVNSVCIGTTDNPLETCDWDANCNAVAVASFSGDPGQDSAMISTKFNAQGMNQINKTGKTQIRVYFDGLLTNGDPNDDYLGFYSGNESDPNKHPKLIVQYKITESE